MTNREWLDKQTDEELRDWLMIGYEKLKFSFYNTYTGLLGWLKETHVDYRESHHLRWNGKAWEMVNSDDK